MLCMYAYSAGFAPHIYAEVERMVSLLFPACLLRGDDGIAFLEGSGSLNFYPTM